MSDFIFYTAIFGIFVFLCVIIYYLIKGSIAENQAKNNFYNLAQKYGFPTNGILSVVGDICYVNGLSYFCENGAGYIADKTFFYFWKKDDTYNFLEMPKEKLFSFKEDELISYTVTGDKKYITKISGGGGGGSSLGGAVAGGILGGATGAIIGSRKTAQPITTDVVTVNNQNTIVNCVIEGNNVHFVFTSGGIYDNLLKMAPSKELNILSKSSSTTQKLDDNDNIERLKQLKELFDSGLISSEEYEEKRKEILSEI